MKSILGLGAYVPFRQLEYGSLGEYGQGSAVEILLDSVDHPVNDGENGTRRNAKRLATQAFPNHDVLLDPPLGSRESPDLDEVETNDVGSHPLDEREVRTDGLELAIMVVPYQSVRVMQISQRVEIASPDCRHVALRKVSCHVPQHISRGYELRI
jgi:hypothetical protein